MSKGTYTAKQGNRALAALITILAIGLVLIWIAFGFHSVLVILAWIVLSFVAGGIFWLLWVVFDTDWSKK